MNVTPEGIQKILQDEKAICVYGLSPLPEKASHSVPLFMKEHGYAIVGIYPKTFSLPEIPIYPNLESVPPRQRRFLNVFRSSENIPALVDEVLQVGGVEILWLQLGITHPEAEKRAEAAGLRVVSNRCLKIEFYSLPRA